MGRRNDFGKLITFNPADLLESLRSYPFLEPYTLALFCEDRGIIQPTHGLISPLCLAGGNLGFRCEDCPTSLESVFSRSVHQNEPVVVRCRTGILNFFVPFQVSESYSCCILGGGVRDENLDLESIEVLAKEKHRSGIRLLEELEKLPVSSEEKLWEVARRTYEILPQMQGENIYTLAFERTMVHLNAIVGVIPEIDRAETTDEVLQLIGESLAVLFDISRAAVIFPDKVEGTASLRCLGQWLDESVSLTEEQALLLFDAKAGRSYCLEDEDALLDLPNVKGEHAVCLPLVAEEQFLGSLVLFDSHLHPRELLLIELLTGRMAMRLHILKKEQEHSLRTSISERVIEMISNLSLLDNQEALFQRIVEMSADLLRASKGSLMVLDENGEFLRIEASLGMNRELARSMRVKVGTGIAGRVAGNGNPLLVNDIEKDARVRSPNRPRFKTKSFISVPLLGREEIVAVLNLSDKAESETFNEEDLRLLTAFAPHFSTLIDRTESLERAKALEELSVTDPLTGLYNRRFLERRMEEEISRCLRQGIALTLILLDLDNFKNYNDICGHLAGDKALKQTARILQKSAREMDIVIRYGGEEFCILLPGTSKKESLLVAERIRHAIEKESFPRERTLPLGKLTGSIGIASFPSDGNTSKALINAADIALYQAKAAGRNRSVQFDPSQKNEKISLV